MGVFDLFKKKNNNISKNPEQSLKLQGPKYLRHYLTPLTSEIADNFKTAYPDVQWIGQLISSTKNRFFQIKYYGDLINDETIIDSEKGVLKAVINDSSTGEEILLFDKMLHGWEGFICNSYVDHKNINRDASKLYQIGSLPNKFQLVFLAFYNEGTKSELQESANSDGNIILENGSTINLQDAFDNAFDAVVIYAIDELGNKYELVNEELA